MSRDLVCGSSLPGWRAGSEGLRDGSGGSQAAVCLPSRRGRSPPSWEAEIWAFVQVQVPNAPSQFSLGLSYPLLPAKTMGPGTL